MNTSKLLFLIVMIIAIASCEQKNGDKPVEPEAKKVGRELYQLKTYMLDTEEQVQVTDGYLKDAFLPALRKIGIGPVGVFKPRPNEEDTTRKIWVLIPFSSMDEFLSLDELLAKDEAYAAAGKDYINASHENPPYQRVESTLLKAFIDMPKMKTPELDGPRADRIYELRSYESPTEKYYWNKVDMFNAGGEVALFDKLNFNAVFYAEVLSGSKMPNLMYMTTFSDQESRDTHWDIFRNAPEWKELSSMPKYQNNVSHADIFFLYPTEYSDY
jgi:hypothetical protein